MNHSFNMNMPLQSVFWSEQRSLAKQTLLIFAAIVILTIASQLTVPLNPVPITFQSATVILIGMACGPRIGIYTIIAYLVSGALGLPVFADFHGGIGELLSPRGGYLLGFAPAVMLSGWLAQRGFAKNILTSFISACISDAIIFIFGVLWLSSFIGWHEAIKLGVLPFITPEAIKLITLSTLVPRMWK